MLRSLIPSILGLCHPEAPLAWDIWLQLHPAEQLGMAQGPVADAGRCAGASTAGGAGASTAGCACGQLLPRAVPQLSSRAVTKSCIAVSPLCPGGGDKAGGCPGVPINTETDKPGASCSLHPRTHQPAPGAGAGLGRGTVTPGPPGWGITRNAADPCWQNHLAEVPSQVFPRGECQGLEQLSASLPLPLIPGCRQHNHSRWER